MSNTLTGGYETVMSKTVQKFLEKEQVFRALASFKEQAVLSEGVTVNRPYRSSFVASDYTANTDVTASSTTLTASNLTVNNSKVISLQFDPVEDIQLLTNPGTLVGLYSERMSYVLKDLLDRDFFDEVDNAALALDESDFLAGSSSGDPIDLDSVNAEEVWNDAYAELAGNNIGSDDLYAVIDPAMRSKISQRAMGTAFQKADDAFMNGFTGKSFAGFKIYVSNNLPTTQAFTLTDATAAITFTIAGVVWTAIDTLGTTAGTVFTDSATLDTWGTNLAKAISGSTAATFYVETSVRKRAKLRTKGLSASYAAGTNILTITGYGRFSASTTDAGVTVGEQTVKAMCGKFGAIDMVVQMQPHIQINKATNNLGSTLLAHTLWGTKTFEDGAERLLKLSIKG